MTIETIPQFLDEFESEFDPLNLADDASEEEIIEALMHVKDTAGRTLRFDHVGRANPSWAKRHEEINELLTRLGY